MYSLVLGLAVIVSAPALKEKKTGLETIVGQWLSVDAIAGGKPEQSCEGLKVTFTVDGRYVLQFSSGTTNEMSYQVDSKSNPPQIDWGDPAGRPDKASRAIYKVVDGVLIICFDLSGERPKEFASPLGSQILLVTLKRQKD